MPEIKPRKSLVRGQIMFDVICECGASHTLAVKPGSLALDIKLLGRKNKIIDSISTPKIGYRPTPVA